MIELTADQRKDVTEALAQDWYRAVKHTGNQLAYHYHRGRFNGAADMLAHFVGEDEVTSIRTDASRGVVDMIAAERRDEDTAEAKGADETN